MLVASDEFAHESADIPAWQENYVWHAWAPESRCGWNLHLGNIVSEGIIDVRAHVIIDGEVTAGSFQTPGKTCFEASGLEADIIAPFERLRLRFAGQGSRGPDKSGWFGRDPGQLPFSLEIDMTTVHAPFDTRSFPGLHGTGDLPGSGNHYELGGSWTGILRSGDKVAEAKGLVVRDHSWGGRIWTWDELFWIPMVFAEQRQYVFNLSARHGTDWTSLSVTMGEHGVIRTADELWVRLGGGRRPRQFAQADVLMGGPGASELATLHGEIHLPVGRARSRIGLSDMYSTVSSGGRIGFGTIQTFPTEDEVREGFEHSLPQFR
jgi:hypothetical protein